MNSRNLLEKRISSLFREEGRIIIPLAPVMVICCCEEVSADIANRGNPRSERASSADGNFGTFAQFSISLRRERVAHGEDIRRVYPSIQPSRAHLKKHETEISGAPAASCSNRAFERNSETLLENPLWRRGIPYV